MVVIFLVLSYGSSMPILYVFAFVYCFITFWIDKIFVLRFYKKQNPFYANDMFMTMLDWMPLAFICHVFYALFFFGFPYILETPSYITRNNIYDGVF